MWLGLLVLAGAGLWQVDVARQNAELAWLAVTGRTWKLRGSLRVVAVPAPALGRGATRQAVVYLPPGYDDARDANRRYAVLYLLHGSPDKGDGWVRYGRAADIADHLIVSGVLPPLLVVCPDGRGDGRFGDSEYVDAPTSPDGKRPGKRVATFITHDLLVFVDSRFRTLSGSTPRARVLGGVSSGGYGAVNLGLQRPDLFGTLLSFSGYYHADDAGWARPVWGPTPDAARLAHESPSDYLAKAAPAAGQSPRWRDTFVYLGNGQDERARYQNEAARFAGELRAAGIPFARRTVPGKHSWDIWRELLGDALRTIKDRLPSAPAAH